MKLILEIKYHAEDMPLYRVVERFPVSLGRGYHNDIIVPDPYVGDTQVRIGLDDAQWVLTDAGSANTTKINDTVCCQKPVVLSSGDILQFGGVTVRVLSPDHTVDPPVTMQESHAGLTWLMQGSRAWGVFVSAVAVIAGWIYLTVWTEDIGVVVTGSVATIIITVFAWAGIWSLIGRLIRRQSFFSLHVVMASVFLMANIVAWYISTYVGFFTHEGLFSRIVTYILNGSMLSFILYGCLSLSTLMAKRKRMLSAVFFSGGLMVGAFTVAMIAAQRFAPHPVYPYRLVPVLSFMAPVETVESFMAGNEALFQSKVFEKIKKKEE